MNKFCKQCKQEVGVKAKISWAWFIAWLLLTGPGVICYIIYALGFKEKTICVKCGCTVDEGAEVIDFEKG